MIIPLKDSTFRLKIPFVTISIILINVVVFIYQSFLPRDSYHTWIMTNGVVIDQLFQNGLKGLLVPFISSLFIHGGVLHLAGNMLYLWIFGDNIESALGHTKFTLFYLMSGIFATICQLLVAPHTGVPIIGASGAISGVLGAYLIRYPRARIQVLIWLFIFIERIWIPAIYVLGFWFLIQVGSGLGTLAFQQSGGVAWFAHIGGFLAGIALLFTLEPYERKRVWKRLNRNY